MPTTLAKSIVMDTVHVQSLELSHHVLKNPSDVDKGDTPNNAPEPSYLAPGSHLAPGSLCADTRHYLTTNIVNFQSEKRPPIHQGKTKNQKTQHLCWRLKTKPHHPWKQNVAESPWKLVSFVARCWGAITIQTWSTSYPKGFIPRSIA